MTKRFFECWPALLALLSLCLAYVDAKNLEIISRRRRVVHGSVKFIRQAEYQVSLRSKSLEKKQGYGHGHLCNGALVTQRAVLIAAHCLWNTETSPATNRSASDLTVVMGTNSLYSKDQYTRQYNVQQWIAHANFSLQTYANDIALLLFNGFVPWNAWGVHAVVLNDQLVPSKSTCTLTKWEQTAEKAASLNLINIRVLNDDTCTANRNSLADSMLCAAYNNIMHNNIDACNGSDGAPLICDNYLAGIHSWDKANCSNSDVAAIFTNVAYYYDWIIMTDSSFPYTYYANSAFKLGRDSILMNLFALIALVYIFRVYHEIVSEC